MNSIQFLLFTLFSNDIFSLNLSQLFTNSPQSIQASSDGSSKKSTKKVSAKASSIENEPSSNEDTNIIPSASPGKGKSPTKGKKKVEPTTKKPTTTPPPTDLADTNETKKQTKNPTNVEKKDNAPVGPIKEVLSAPEGNIIVVPFPEDDLENENLDGDRNTSNPNEREVNDNERDGENELGRDGRGRNGRGRNGRNGRGRNNNNRQQNERNNEDDDDDYNNKSDRYYGSKSNKRLHRRYENYPSMDNEYDYDTKQSYKSHEFYELDYDLPYYKVKNSYDDDFRKNNFYNEIECDYCFDDDDDKEYSQNSFRTSNMYKKYDSKPKYNNSFYNDEF